MLVLLSQHYVAESEILFEEHLFTSTFPQVEVFMQRITFLESKITPCEQEAAQAGALREELEAKSQECADL
jgi:hypothetical protein